MRLNVTSTNYTIYRQLSSTFCKQINDKNLNSVQLLFMHWLFHFDVFNDDTRLTRWWNCYGKRIWIFFGYLHFMSSDRVISMEIVQLCPHKNAVWHGFINRISVTTLCFDFFTKTGSHQSEYFNWIQSFWNVKLVCATWADQF